MAGDRTRWALARLAAAGDPGLSPGPRPGRFSVLRLYWAAAVRAALDQAARYRAAAACPAADPRAAADLFDRATAIEVDGPGAVRAGLGTKEEAVAEWARATGIDPADPAQMDKVYAAVAAMRKAEVEAAEETRRRAARTRTPPGRGRRGPGKL